MSDEDLKVDVGVLKERMSDVQDALSAHGDKLDALAERVGEWAEASRSGHAGIEKRLVELETTVSTAKTAGAWLARRGLPVVGLILAGGFLGDPIARAAKWLMGDR